MDSDTKRMFGKLLGEILRIQRATPDMSCSSSDAQIFALLNGFEDAVDDVLEGMGSISKKKLQDVMDILEPYWKDENKAKTFKGFYDIEPALQRKDIDRTDAIKILTYLKANSQFTDIIARMDTSDSPMECRKFDIGQWDK